MRDFKIEVRFVITSMISDQNCTTRGSITTLLHPFWNRLNTGLSLNILLMQYWAGLRFEIIFIHFGWGGGGGKKSVVLRRTDVGSGDWRFDNLSGSHLQSQVNSCCQSNVLSPVCINWLVSFAVMLLAVRFKWRRSVVFGWSRSVSEVRSFCSVRL